eukprot:SAG31_NODE_880_length_11279_cov_154.463238_6_plen_1383_part_00
MSSTLHIATRPIPIVSDRTTVHNLQNCTRLRFFRLLLRHLCVPNSHCCVDLLLPQALNYRCSTKLDANEELRTSSCNNNQCSEALHDGNLCNRVDTAERLFRLRSEMEELDNSQQMIARLIDTVESTLQRRHATRASLITAAGSIQCPAGTEPAGTSWYMAPDPCTPCDAGTSSPSGVSCSQCNVGCRIISATQGCDCSNTPVDKYSSKITIPIQAGILDNEDSMRALETSFKLEMARALNVGCDCDLFSASMIVIERVRVLDASDGRRRLQTDSISLEFSIVSAPDTLPIMPNLDALPAIDVEGASAAVDASTMDQPEMIPDTTRQIRCLPGQELVRGECGSCSGNSFSSGMGECTECPTGTTVNAGKTQCIHESCPAGQQPVLFAHSGAFGVVTRCDPCLRGQVSDGTSCENCPTGQEAVETADACRECSECAPTCDDGFELSDDSICQEVNECIGSTNPCLMIPASCQNTPGSYTCSCPQNSVWNEGTKVCDCALQCGGASHGSCVKNDDQEFECACYTGWTGADCTTESGADFGPAPAPSDPVGPAPPGPAAGLCSQFPCQNGAQCSEIDDGYSCTCAAGFSGTNCATNINDCESNPCANSGRCSDGFDAYTCDCSDTNFGGDNCEIEDGDECANDPCTSRDDSATCTDGRAEFFCTCSSLYRGSMCEVRTCPPGQALVETNALVFECQPCSGNTYSARNGELCQPCDDGTSANPDNSACVDDCPCGEALGGCDDCTSRCRTSCADYQVPRGAIDGCDNEFAHCDHRCDAGKVYNVNTGECSLCGLYERFEGPNSCVQCPEGQRRSAADGLNCECDIESGFESDSTDGSCVCPAGFQSNGESPAACIDIDECASNPCGENFGCENGASSYRCVCDAVQSGYEQGTGGRCVDINECENDPNQCENGEVCENHDGGYSCMLPACVGIDCGQTFNPPHGQCNPDTRTCSCTSPWSGPNCATSGDPCIDSPCANGGECTSNGNAYSCSCADGWQGTHCDEDEDECERDPAICENDAICENLDRSGADAALARGYECTCGVQRVPTDDGDNYVLRGWSGNTCADEDDSSMWYIEGFARVSQALYSAGQFKAELAWLLGEGVAKYEASNPPLLKSGTGVSTDSVLIESADDEGDGSRKVKFYLRFQVNFDEYVEDGISEEDFQSQAAVYEDTVVKMLNSVNDEVAGAFEDGTCTSIGDLTTCKYSVVLTSDLSSVSMANSVSATAQASGYTFFQPNRVNVVVGDVLAVQPNNMPGTTYYGLRPILGEKICMAGDRALQMSSCVDQEAQPSSQYCFCTEFPLNMNGQLRDIVEAKIKTTAIIDDEDFPVWGIIVLAIGGALLIFILLLAFVPGHCLDVIRKYIGCARCCASEGSKYSTTETSASN